MKSLPNLLIVDDNIVNLRYLEIIVKDLNINLITAESGLEALEKTKDLELILAILDVQMPGMDGYELALKLNEKPGKDRVPVIFVTANYIDESDVFQGYDSGAVDYIFKPVNRYVLLSKIKVFLDLFMQKQIIIQDVDLLKKKSEELIRVNSALKESDKKYRSYINNAPVGVFITDKAGNFFEVNEAACRITGYPRRELLKMSILEFLSGESVKENLVQLSQVFESGEFNTDLLFRHKNGTERWLSVNAVKLNKTRFLVFTKDITERKLTENLLKESESNLATAQRIAHIGSWEWDKLSDTVKLSKEMYHVFDINADTFDGKPESLLELLHPDDVECITDRILKCKTDSDNLISLECRVIHKDGSIHNLFAEARIEYDEAGNAGNLIGTVQDISERKLAEQTLKISEEKYRTMLNASPDGILLIDLKGFITEVSEIGLELFGTNTRDDLVGKDFHQFVPSEEKNTIKEIFEKAMNEGLAQNIGIKLRKKNQSVFDAEISSTLIQGPDGAPLSFMIIIRDISQRKKVEAKQVHADRMANLGEMASGIAHEINQPLNIISMVMDKILFETVKTDTIDIEFLKNKSDKIFDNITRIRNIIDHVRAFSRSDDDYVLTAFDINSSIENATSMIMEQFKHLGIKMNFRLDKNIPQLVGNTYKFEQVIVNLLANAKDAVIEKKSKQEKYGEMIVEIKTYQENQFLIVEIADNGIGIENDDIHNIILPFYTTKDEGKGTGLGLSICYQIITEMNGTIDITSDKVNGTKIKLILAIQRKK